MISCSTGEEKEATPSVEELLTEFQLFRNASESLEKAYGELKRQAQRVDHELAEANQRLREGLAEREGILGALPLGVFRRTPDGLTPLNPEAESLLQRVRSDQLLAGLENREAGEITLDDDQGRAVSMRVTSVEVAARQETLEFVEDQTEVEAMRAELSRLARLSSLSELALGVAHEVRNPLNGVAGFAGMLKRCPESPKAAHWAARIEEGAWRVERIVSELLSFARPEERAEPCVRSLHTWLSEARLELPTLEIRLVDEAARCELLGSPQALGKVFANLLRNAQEARAGCVIFAVEPVSADRVRLVIQDDGEGISEDIRERIFDPFVGSKEQGTGLGLAFCARALEAMNGSIRSMPCASGARFFVELPGRCHE